MQDSSATILSSVKKFFSGTLISRLTGFGREVAMAAAFGVMPAVAAFWMAFRFALLLRRLLGEGGLHVAFIPHFESLRKKDPQEAAIFFYQLSSWLTRFLCLLTIALEGILGGFLWFGDFSPYTQEVVKLTMLLLPSLIFICLYALNQSLLNCEGCYFLPSAAPSLFNVIWIGALFFVWQMPAPLALELLSMLIVFAFAMQWLITLPPVYHYLKRAIQASFWQRKEKTRGQLGHLLRPLALSLIGVAAMQINSGLDAIFARLADPEGPAILWYALRIEQLPLALLGVAMTSALLPPISRAVEAQDEAKCLHFLSFAINRTSALMIPVTCALFILGFTGINLAYGRGHFTTEAIIDTTICLWGYGGGLLPMSLVLIFASFFYAKKDYKTPTLTSLFSVCANLVLNAFFVFVCKGGAVSIAVATTLATFINAGLLLFFILKEHVLSLRPFWSSLGRITAASLIAVGGTLLVGAYFNDPTVGWFKGNALALPRSFGHQLMAFAVQCLLFGGFLVVGAFVAKSSELLALVPFRIKEKEHEL